ncbi:MAG: hypothetical protein ACXVA9_06495 [Bdellovibrionales bacterium]
MINVLSLVNFDNTRRAAYLERSFGSFYRHNSGVQHWVLDSSRSLEAQQPYYKKFGVQVIHRPGATFGQRLHEGLALLREDYFVFLPDDFEWIFAYPLERAIAQCRAHGIAELYLRPRGMKWYSQAGAAPQAWFEGAKLISGETLRSEDDLRVSRRWLLRDFHEQFSLGCNVLQTEFARSVIGKIPSKVKSPGQVEKNAYVRLLFHRYATAYYKMWTPAFHFIDLSVEGDNDKNREKAETNLIAENIAVYNGRYNV